MHVLSRNRSAIAVVAVILAGIIGAWLVATSGGDPGRTDAAPDAGATQSSGAEAGDGTGEQAGRGPGKKSSRDGASGDVKSGTGASGSATASGSTGSSGDGKSGGGTSGGGTSGAEDGAGGGAGTPDATSDDTTDTESDDQEPGTATGATVPVEPVQTLAPVPLESVGDFRTGLTVQLASISAVEAEAKAPGEISGPALRVTVDAANDAGEAVSLDGVVVFLSYGDDRTPASQFGSSSDPLVGDLAPGGSRTGTYVFSVPPDQRDDVRVEISYTGSAPTVAFTGSVDG
jgi:hypothetical protein